MERVLVSACLLGERVRYDAKAAALQDDRLATWIREGRVVPICPEMAGGLPTPRPPAEIVGGGGAEVLDGSAAVRTEPGSDATAAFVAGAERALALARREGIRIAILKERSPSCGSSEIYDGSFRGRRIPGAGVTAALLRQHGIAVYSEEQIGDAARALAALEGASVDAPGAGGGRR